MPRTPTSNIKDRRKVSIYPTQDLFDRFVQLHIQLQSRLGKYVDKTILTDAIIEVGMMHHDEVVKQVKLIENQEMAKASEDNRDAAEEVTPKRRS